MNGSDCLVPGDWISIDGEVYVAALVDKGKIGLIGIHTGRRWSEPTDYCGSAPNGGTPLANFCVGPEDKSVFVKPGPSRGRTR